MNYLAFHIFRQQYTTHPWKDTRIKPILDDVARVGALHQLMENVGPVFDAEYFAPSAFKLMSEALEHITHKLRPQLIPLAETKSLPDFVVPSVIGNSYGDIYEKQFAEAKDSALKHLDVDG